jgi:hypothetical protein
VAAVRATRSACLIAGLVRRFASTGTEPIADALISRAPSLDWAPPAIEKVTVTDEAVNAGATQRSSPVRRERRQGGRPRNASPTSTASVDARDTPTASAIASARRRASTSARAMARGRAASTACRIDSSVSRAGAVTRASPAPLTVTPGP